MLPPEAPGQGPPCPLQLLGSGGAPGLVAALCSHGVSSLRVPCRDTQGNRVCHLSLRRATDTGPSRPPPSKSMFEYSRFGDLNSIALIPLMILNLTLSTRTIFPNKVTVEVPIGRIFWERAAPPTPTCR